MIKWKEAELGEYCDFQEGYVNPSKEHPEYFGGSVKWCRAVDINDGYIYHTSQTLTEEGFKSAKKSALLFEPNTIVISKSGTIGRVGIIKDYMCGNRATINIKPKNNADVEFIFYMLKSKQREFADLAVGSVQKNLYVSILEKIKFKFPSLDNQKKISSYISTIDKKIEINNQINRNLSEQAMAIFTDLFGDADKDATVDEVSLNVTDGVHNTVKDDSEGKFFLLSCKNIKGGSLSLGEAERRINQETFEKLRKRTKLEKGDILLSSVGTIGELLLMSFDPDKYEFQRSVAIIKPNSDVVSSEYLYCALLAQKQEIIRAAHGAVQQCIFISDIKGFTIHKPTSERLIQFDNAVVPMMKMIYQNEEENKRLSLLRDTLLPKLMSGELDVSELDI